MANSTKALNAVREYRAINPDAETLEVKKAVIDRGFKIDMRDSRVQAILNDQDKDEKATPVDPVDPDNLVHGDKKRATIEWLKAHPDVSCQEAVKGIFDDLDIDIVSSTFYSAKKQMNGQKSMSNRSMAGRKSWAARKAACADQVDIGTLQVAAKLVKAMCAKHGPDDAVRESKKIVEIVARLIVE